GGHGGRAVHADAHADERGAEQDPDAGQHGRRLEPGGQSNLDRRGGRCCHGTSVGLIVSCYKMPVYAGTETTRKSELASFLRERRGRLQPETVGLPNGSRRRTPGLRREEVAQLAGVGLTWYTWLEQGRDIRVSPDVLCRVARVLQLEPIERIHLFRLAGHEAQPRFVDEAVRPPLRRVLAGWEPYPAIVLGRRWDVLAWNRAYVRVLGDYSELPEGRRNVLWSMFMRPSRRRLIRDWAREAEVMVASFQRSTAAYLDEPDFQELITDLREQSPEFAALWARHDVRGRLEG